MAQLDLNGIERAINLQKGLLTGFQPDLLFALPRIYIQTPGAKRESKREGNVAYFDTVSE